MYSSEPEQNTVEFQLKRIFPEGTRASFGLKDDWSKPPLLPTDLFATAAYLLEASGAYQFIVAPFVGPKVPKDGYAYSGPTFGPKKREIDRWSAIGALWRVDFTVVDKGIAKLWQKLWLARHESFIVDQQAKRSRPKWWSVAHAMLVIADEACVDIGYLNGDETSDAANLWQHQLLSAILETATEKHAIKRLGRGPKDQTHLSTHVKLDSIALESNRNVVRVMPKGRTAELGCTLRTFSHNLALLPPHGYANAYWHQASSLVSHIAANKLNILAIPFPYSFSDSSFRGMESEGRAGETRWGRFKIDQTWLRPQGPDDPTDANTWSDPASRRTFTAFVDALLDAAAESGRPANGVVLPEYALDWETYDVLARHIRDKRPEVEFLVAGISKDCHRRLGNQVAVTVFQLVEGIRYAQTHSRRKHHRWRIEASQIAQYGLKLDTGVVWWEYLEVEERVSNVDVLRKASTFTAVICEDLARVDPGLSVLRALGPNLVFALLMDGAQVIARWPGVYVTGLADDPGSSVLSFTSLALVDRSIRIRARGEKRYVALWKNHPRNAAEGASPNDFQQLEVPPGHHALLLSLVNEPASETTITGRPNSDAAAWYLDQCNTLQLPDAIIHEKGWKWIVEGNA